MIIALFTLLACIYLFFGLYVVSLDYKNRLNQLFFLISLFYVVPCVVAIFMQLSPVAEPEPDWAMLGVICYNVNWYLMFMFQLFLTRIFKPKWYLHLVLIAPLVYLVVRLILAPDFAVYTEINQVKNISAYSLSFHHLLTQISIVAFFYFFLSVTTLFIGRSRTTERKLKKQITVILISQIICVSIAFTDQVVLFVWSGITITSIPGMSLVYSLIWVFGIWVALVKYRLMAVTPATISHEILNNIDETVMLLDTGYNLVTMNKKATKFLTPNTSNKAEHISCHLKEFDKIRQEIDTLRKEKQMSFSCKVHFNGVGNEETLMDAIFKLLMDEYGDLIGYLIIANEVKDYEFLKNKLKISNREAMVIQQLLSGQTNQEISEVMHISERTVKSHITNIFNKLGVDNRVQLLMLLKDFKLLPDQPADKMLFFNTR